MKLELGCVTALRGGARWGGKRRGLGKRWLKIKQHPDRKPANRQLNMFGRVSG